MDQWLSMIANRTPGGFLEPQTAAASPDRIREDPEQAGAPAARRLGWKRMALALAVAAASDALAWALELLPPLEWALDLATALALFAILGRRWAILPGLIAEAIPGWGVFPAWIFVVLSIFLYDDIRR